VSAPSSSLKLVFVSDSSASSSAAIASRIYNVDYNSIIEKKFTLD